MAELHGYALLELLREHVLEHLGLDVDAIPRHAELVSEIELQQAVMADHLQGKALAGGVRATPW
jgi:hypothetical protein